MPNLALALCLLWFVALFVVRTAIQLRNTGSTGLKGFHGRIGSLPWTAGAMTSLGFVLTPLAPAATLLGWPGGASFVTQPIVHALGAAATLAGIVGALRAQLEMGDAWRVGVDESERTQLVTSGLFARVRNPIFSFMGISAVGILLLVPSAFTLAAVTLAAAGIALHVRWVEEPHLERTHGRAYVEYAARVGRFFPGVGLRSGRDGASAGGVLRG